MWIKDHEGDLINTEWLSILYVSCESDDDIISYWVKAVSLMKDIYTVRGPFDTKARAYEALDLLMIDMAVL